MIHLALSEHMGMYYIQTARHAENSIAKQFLLNFPQMAIINWDKKSHLTLQVALTSAGKSSPERRRGRVCTPSWTEMTRRQEERRLATCRVNTSSTTWDELEMR